MHTGRTELKAIVLELPNHSSQHAVKPVDQMILKYSYSYFLLTSLKYERASFITLPSVDGIDRRKRK